MNLQWTDILIIVLVILVLFGATKLPQLGRAVGKSVSEFKKGLKEGEEKPAKKAAAKKKKSK